MRLRVVAGQPVGIPDSERRDRSALAAWQGQRLADLLAHIHGRNPFYTRKLDAAGIRLDSLRLPRDLRTLPLTTKAELVADQRGNPPWGTALTEPLVSYVRYNQTSATTGEPLRWLDSTESWQSMLECWKAVYRAARVGAEDRIVFAFSFGPFLGFWTAFEAGCQMGAHCIPAGGMSSQLRLAMIDALEPTVLCCTPTYALRLAEVAAGDAGSARLASCSVQVLIVAGEPGGSVPATRQRIERSWGARVIDHHGLTEVGPISFECWESPGFLHVYECEYICEVLAPGTVEPVEDGSPGELVITTLGRTASPVIRYRTGDIVVRRLDPCPCGRTLARIEGGILGRVDDMITVRGVNIYPTAIEAIVRQFAEVVEYRSTVSSVGSLRVLAIEIELARAAGDGQEIERRLSDRLLEALGLKVPVTIVMPGTLPRFEMKAKRFIIEQSPP